MQLSSTWAVIVTAIPALLVILSGVLKLVGFKQVVDSLTKMGVIQYLQLFGIAEIIFSLLFVYPPTNLIGFVLLACYFSGAIAVDLSYKNPLVPPMMILGFVFLAEFIAYGYRFLG